MDPTQDRFDRLWREVERSVVRVVTKTARFATREDVEDIVLDVRLRAWSKFDRYNPEKSFGAWVGIMAKRTAINWVASAVRRPSFGLLEAAEECLTDEGPSPSDLATAEELSEEVLNALSCLDAIFLNAFLLRFKGCSYEDAARLLDCPVGTVRSRYSRATSRLRELLGPDFLASCG